MRKSVILSLFFFFLIPFLLAQISENDRVLKVGVEGDLNLTNLWNTSFAVDAKILWNIFEPLVTLEEKNTQIKPCLAISWQVSNNNRTWLFKLREGVRFHDGSSLRADDVVASTSLFLEFEAKVEKVDALTVRFTLAEPNSGFLHKLALPKYAIASAETVELYRNLELKGRTEEFLPIGSGPFKFSRWEKGKQIVLESFADYWQGSPWIKKLVYQVISDNKERLSALEKGEIDLIDVLFPADLIQLRKNPELKILSKYGMNICYIGMNTAHKPLDNIMVRQALNLAVDKLRVARMFYFGGYGAPTNRILSPAFWGFSATPSSGSYQPAKTKQMLAEAGYNKSLSLKLVCVPVARPYVPDPQGVAIEIKRQLAYVGAKVQIIVPPNYSEFLSTLDRRDFDLVLSGWIDMTGDPDYTLNSLLSGKMYPYNLTSWHNNLFDEKLMAARELPISDVKSRIKLYNEAQKIFQQEAPWIPLFHTKIFVIHNKKVKGIILYPSTMVSYHKVRFES